MGCPHAPARPHLSGLSELTETGVHASTAPEPSVALRARAISNRITRLLAIDYPIVQGGMQWVGTAELAAAVSNAGGLGVLTALTQRTAAELTREIGRCRALTDRPFAVNLTILPAISPPPYHEYVEAIVASGVRIVETAGNSPRLFMRRLKECGVVVIHKCVSIRHALSAQRLGADIITVDGFECAGHTGEDDIPNLILIPSMSRALEVPLLASGGFADGYGMAAALCLGAEGVSMGTRFLCTREAPVHENIKRALVQASELDTRLILRSLGNSTRVFRNEIAEAVLTLERRAQGAVFEELRPLVTGQRTRAAFECGDPQAGIVGAGMAIGLITDVPSCDALIQRTVGECRRALRNAARWGNLRTGSR